MAFSFSLSFMNTGQAALCAYGSASGVSRVRRLPQVGVRRWITFPNPALHSKALNRSEPTLTKRKFSCSAVGFQCSVLEISQQDGVLATGSALL